MAEPIYPNPYDFVPLEKRGPVWHEWQADEDGLDRWHPGRYSGRLHCLLHPETPLFIHGSGQQKETKRQFFQQNGEICIPASTLKGALRSIYEIVSNSCLSSMGEKYQAPLSHKRTYGEMSQAEYDDLHPVYSATKILPQAYQLCTHLSQACPTCLLFGMVEHGQEEGKPLAGRLVFSDARPVEARVEWVNIPAAGGGPHPWHSTFYLDSTGKILGRKLYYHHQNFKNTLALYGDGGRSGLIQAEGQRGDFRFTVDFQNLTEDELTYLTYTLVLEKDLRHHLGYGKPYGLGSTQINIERIQFWERPGSQQAQRFLTLQSKSTQPKETQQWIERRADRTLALWGSRLGNDFSTYGKFKQLLSWPGYTLYQYPSFHWFRRTPGSGAITLAEYQRGQREPNNGGNGQ